MAAGLQPQNVKVKDFLSEFGSFMLDPYERLETMEEGFEDFKSIDDKETPFNQILGTPRGKLRSS